MSDETTPQDSAAMSPASAGSVEPVAWWFKCNDYESVAMLREHADAMAEPYGTTPVPLFRHPQPTLTDAERMAVEFALCSLGRDDYLNERHAEQLRETLDRLIERMT